MVGERETSAHAASPTWPQGWEKEKTGVFPRQGCDWEASTSEECMTSPQLLILITTTLWGLNSNLFTFSLLSWLLVNALLYCIASFISKPDQKKFSLALFLWLFVNFKALQDYAEKERYFHPWSEIDSFLSPKCFKKIINKRQSNSRQDRWMWSFCFGWCWQCWALAVYFAWVKCWTKCYFHRDTMCVYVCMCMYACMYVYVCMYVCEYFYAPHEIFQAFPQDKMHVHPAASSSRPVFTTGSRGSPWVPVQDVFPDVLCSTPTPFRWGLH